MRIRKVLGWIWISPAEQDQIHRALSIAADSEGELAACHHPRSWEKPIQPGYRDALKAKAVYEKLSVRLKQRAKSGPVRE
jgi:hypothetical protein